MWKNIVLILIASAGVIGIFVSCKGLSVKGNGDIRSAERIIPFFDTIQSSVTGIVEVYKNDVCKVIICIDSNLEKYIKIDVKDGILIIDTNKYPRCIFSEFTVKVYAPHINGIALAGTGGIKIIDGIAAPAMDINVTGKGSVEGSINCDAVTINITGGGSIKINGSGKISDITINGNGHFYGSEYQTDDVSVKLAGAGGAEIYAVNTLHANITGSGKIKYKGNPELSLTKKGNGAVTAIQ